jgi:hypothetical protein
VTTNQESHTLMLNKMHPELWKKFGNQLHLNQKFHPQMTGKSNNGSGVSQTPNSYKGNITLLQGPVRPKPPPFNDQAYHNKEDWTKKTVSQSQGRPYKPFANSDAKAYMNQPKFQKNQQKTIDQYKHRKGGKKVKKATVKKDEDGEWERFNENVRYYLTFNYLIAINQACQDAVVKCQPEANPLVD